MYKPGLKGSGDPKWCLESLPVEMRVEEKVEGGHCPQVIASLSSSLYLFCVCQDQLLFCDDCDRGYHMYCLNPPVAEPPEGNDDELPSSNGSSCHSHLSWIPHCGACLVLRDVQALSHLTIMAQ